MQNINSVVADSLLVHSPPDLPHNNLAAAAMSRNSPGSSQSEGREGRPSVGVVTPDLCQVPRHVPRQVPRQVARQGS